MWAAERSPSLLYCRYGCDAEEELGNGQELNHIQHPSCLEVVGRANHAVQHMLTLHDRAVRRLAD